MSNINCKHYVKRKKRYCKMTVKKGFEYCGEHLPPNSENSEGNVTNDKMLRIVCPLDNKHTCFAHKLQKHLKICNAKPNTSLPYILKGVNSGDVIPDSNKTFTNMRQLSSVEPEMINTLVKKINKIYDEILKGKIVENFAKHEVVESEAQKPEYGDKTKKHLIQASSILGILKENGLLGNNVFIEFGAGKGQLSYWISKATANMEESKDASVLLVERASHRHKFDNKLNKTEGKVHRVKADIADLILKRVEAVKDKSVVGLTKHLCGDATDLALRCLKNFEKDGGEIEGIVMAFCCHHRCQWTAYTGKDFFMKNSLNHADFDVMCGMVSWAICGTGQSREISKNGTSITDTSDRDKAMGLTRDDKTEIGRRCKNLLDYGRMLFMESNGFQCVLNYYVDSSISPENVCMVAKNKKVLALADKFSGEAGDNGRIGT